MIGKRRSKCVRIRTKNAKLTVKSRIISASLLVILANSTPTRHRDFSLRAPPLGPSRFPRSSPLRKNRCRADEDTCNCHTAAPESRVRLPTSIRRTLKHVRGSSRHFRSPADRQPALADLARSLLTRAPRRPHSRVAKRAPRGLSCGRRHRGQPGRYHPLRAEVRRER